VTRLDLQRIIILPLTQAFTPPRRSFPSSASCSPTLSTFPSNHNHWAGRSEWALLSRSRPFESLDLRRKPLFQKPFNLLKCKHLVKVQEPFGIMIPSNAYELDRLFERSSAGASKPHLRLHVHNHGKRRQEGVVPEKSITILHLRFA
jgi:hypothetical protein